MANQPPPPFGGHSNNAQQWPFAYPIVPPSLPPNREYLLRGQAHPPYLGQSAQHNIASFDSNSRLSASSGSALPGFFSQPEFPLVGTQSNIPQPPISSFQSMPISSVGLLASTAPVGFSNSLGAPPHSDIAASMNQQQHPLPQLMVNESRPDPNREEGEISDGEDGCDFTTRDNVCFTNEASSRQRSATQRSELEEGETLSTQSHSSSRSSGSPYNPPLSVSADPDVVDRAIQMQKRDAEAAGPEVPQALKSAAQLRVQAQGALLSLAPHNIRYSELVAEGINPTILKRLYEDVGIKVAPLEAPKPAKLPSKITSMSAQRQSVTGAAKPVPTTEKAELQMEGTNRVFTPKSKLAVAPNSAPPVSSADHSNAEKPMERKDVIARMLAAKAAKISESSTSKPLPTEMQIVPPISIPSTASSTESKESGAPGREKNKAQTELARQRIEALKRQALLKQQQKAEQSNESSRVNTLVAATEASAPTVQHPLPVRPPIPQPTEPAIIPGLSINELQHEGNNQALIGGPQGIAIDPTPISRLPQRKRPRATDFDESAAVPKKHIHHATGYPDAPERLVIDISDDESLYGDDENGDTMDVESGLEAAAPANAHPADTSKPNFSKYATITRASASTPQATPRPSDNEHIRQRDLEIQAMHRKIAELERRRKEKLVLVQTESSRASGNSGISSTSSSSSSAARASPVAVDVGQSLPVPSTSSKVTTSSSTTVTSLPRRPNLIDSFSESSVKVLASMKFEQLDSIRSKILRMREIESGLPGLDAEITTESRLAACREEAERLVSEITHGKQGRSQLVEELKNLSHEINGLSIEDLNELRRQAGVKQQQLAAKEASISIRCSSPTKDGVIYDVSNTETGIIVDTLETSAPTTDIHPDTMAKDVLNDDLEESSSASQSESTGSVMDESIASAGVEESLSREDSLSGSEQQISHPSLDLMPSRAIQVPAHAPANPEAAIEEALRGHVTPTDSSSGGEALASDERHVMRVEHDSLNDSVQRKSPPGAAESELEVVVDSQHRDSDSSYNPPSRAASADSDAYEPPEPNPDVELVKSAYSPHSDPSSISDEKMAEPVSSHRNPNSDETLTDAPQMSAVQRRSDLQFGILGTQVPPIQSKPKFSPYVSPLRSFKSYRYHPNYAEDVSNGYRSLTYSHNIDSMKHLCPFESAGGVCNDRSCRFQHFRDMTLSDDKILIQMGAVREGQTTEERKAYLTGLKEIINEMRHDKVKDFNIVATEIAAYRRRFLQDPSRVLSL